MKTYTKILAITLFVVTAVSLSVSFSAFAEGGHKHDYHHLQMAFEAKGQLPEVSELAGGMYSGRCYTEAEPEVEKSGLLNLIKADDGTVKVILPATTISDRDPAQWDDLDENEIRYLTEASFADENQAATVSGRSLTSFLQYETGYPVGMLHMRAHHNHFLLKMTNFTDAYEEGEKTYFFCHFDRKVN